MNKHMQEQSGYVWMFFEKAFTSEVGFTTEIQHMHMMTVIGGLRGFPIGFAFKIGKPPTNVFTNVLWSISFFQGVELQKIHTHLPTPALLYARNQP